MPTLPPALQPRKSRHIASIEDFDARFQSLRDQGYGGRELLHQMIGLFDDAHPWPGRPEDARERVERALRVAGEPVELWPTYRRMMVTDDVVDAPITRTK